MSRFDCKARDCTWRPNGESAGSEQLREHALEQGHGLCAVCSLSLTEHEPQTCADCLLKTGQTLAGIGLLYDELPAMLGHLKSPSFDGERPAADDGRPLPGGDALVLLGPGSEGLAEDGTTTKQGDPGSVAFELGWWAAEWAGERGDTLVLSGRRMAGQVHGALDYLARHMRWAANTHQAFAEFASDLNVLHGTLERATARDTVTPVAEAECFDCSSDLIREMRPPNRCRHERPQFPPSRVVVNGQIVDVALPDRRSEYETAQQTYEQEHGRCQQGGYVDTWKCRGCGRVYQWTEYILALRSRVEDGKARLRHDGWGTPRQVAEVLQSSVETVRTWGKRAMTEGGISAACAIASRELIVSYPEAEAKRRRRAPAA